MKSTRLEPGILTIFRLFLIFQFILMMVNLMVHHARKYLEGHPELAIAFVSTGLVMMLIYLSSHWLEGKLGSLYLPIGLICSTVFSLVAQNIFLTLPISNTTGGGAESAWQLFLFLFVPLVLVGWQYGLKSVIAYCLFTTILDYALIRFTNPDYEAFQQTFHRLEFIRFISFLLVGYVIARITQQLRRERQALQEANQKLEHYVGTLEQLTVSRERNRVARELHDTLAHTLSGVAVQLEAVDSLWSNDRQQAHDILQHSLKATRDGLTETRKAIEALRATPLVDLGLVHALRAYAQATAERTGFGLSLELPDRLEGLPSEVEQCFYRIGQEALENISRHAQASSVQVRLARSASGLRMEISDNGVGFDLQSSESGRHFGLQGMHERAQVIGAVLEITSRPGGGTQLSLTWNEANRQEGHLR
jgi:signal transduction histidine kinase